MPFWVLSPIPSSGEAELWTQRGDNRTVLHPENDVTKWRGEEKSETDLSSATLLCGGTSWGRGSLLMNQVVSCSDLTTGRICYMPSLQRKPKPQTVMPGFPGSSCIRSIGIIITCSLFSCSTPSAVGHCCFAVQHGVALRCHVIKARGRKPQWVDFELDTLQYIGRMMAKKKKKNHSYRPILRMHVWQCQKNK